MSTLESYAQENRVNSASDQFLLIPAAGTTAATPLDCLGTMPSGLVIPAAWTSCTLTFQGLPYIVSPLTKNTVANADLVAICDETGTAFSIAVTAGGIYLPLSPSIFNAVRYLNVTCSVAQAAARQISVSLVPIWNPKI